MNDGACDAAGRFWAGTMCMQERPGRGSSYRLDPDGTTHTMVTGVGISNGIDWSPDGTRMYYVDSLTQRIDQFDFDLATGTIANRRAARRQSMRPTGSPDGLTVDAEGASGSHSGVGRRSTATCPTARLDRILRVPVIASDDLCLRRTGA